MELDHTLFIALMGILICHSATLKIILADTSVFDDFDLQHVNSRAHPKLRRSTGQAMGSQSSSGESHVQSMGAQSNSDQDGSSSQAWGSQSNSGGSSSQAMGAQSSSDEDRLSSQAIGSQSSSGGSSSQSMGAQSNSGNGSGKPSESEDDDQNDSSGTDWSWRHADLPEGSKGAASDWDWEDSRPQHGSSGEATGFQFGSNGTSSQGMAVHSSSGSSGASSQASGSQLQSGHKGGSSGLSMGAQPTETSGQTSGFQVQSGPHEQISGQSGGALSSTGNSGSFSQNEKSQAQSKPEPGASVVRPNGGWSQATGSQVSSGSDGISSQILDSQSSSGSQMSEHQSEKARYYENFAMAINLICNRFYELGSRRFNAGSPDEETINKTVVVLTETARQVGPQCFGRLFCECGADPTPYGNFAVLSEQLFRLMDSEVPEDFYGYYTAYTSGKNRTVAICSKEFQECHESSAELQKAAHDSSTRF